MAPSAVTPGGQRVTSHDANVARLVLIRLLSSAVDLVSESDALLANDVLFASAVRSAGLVLCGVADLSKDGGAAASSTSAQASGV